MEFNFVCLILFIFSALIVSGIEADTGSIVPVDLRTEYLVYPLTLETPNPRFSWKLHARNDFAKNLTQTAYQILVSSAPSNGTTADLWDSGVVKSDANVHIRYNGKMLQSRQLAVWKVKVWDQNGATSESSTNGQFGIGLLHSDWKAKWIHAPKELQDKVVPTLQQEDQLLIEKEPGLVPPLYFRKEFQLEQIYGARLFSTAKGLYELYLNGHKVHTSHFNPGNTDYHKTIRYQSFENVEQYLQTGKNVIGVVVATGWYAGYLGYNHKFAFYGTDIGALVQLDINNITVVESDSTWKVATGPIVYSDMLMGETYYVEKEMNGWNEANFNDSKWIQATVQPRDVQVAIKGDVSEATVTTMTLNPISMHETKPGVFIFDFGQNFAGLCSIQIHEGHEHARIQLRHGEVLENPYMKGTLYTKNLRTARATDTLVITSRVTKSFTFTPTFTIHGFRFVELSGYRSTPKLTDIVANVIHSGFSVHSSMKTSNQLVNRLLLNIQWSLRSNFLSIPTDCPQRDERLGWAGDAQVFAPTAVYNADLAAFYTKWMADLRDSQLSKGGIPDSAPIFDKHNGSPGWQDAFVIIPWLVYSTYGDKNILEDNYAALVKYINYIKVSNPDNIWKNVANIYGDWLEMNATTESHVLSTAYYAQDALLMSKIAAVLGKSNDAKMYLEMFHNISATFNEHFVKPDGTIQGDTQSSYAFALAFLILPEKIRLLAVKKLVDNIKQHKMHLTTGFFGVGLVNPVLTEFGHNDVAYQLLLQNTYPSWLYPVAHGNATTIWERWDGWTEGKGIYESSFNHYSFGSVGVWLYSKVAGINSDGAGFKNIIIKPNPASGLTSVNATYDSIHGAITSSWIVNNGTIHYQITIPVNTRATVILPGKNTEHQVGSGIWDFSEKNYN